MSRHGAREFQGGIAEIPDDTQLAAKYIKE